MADENTLKRINEILKEGIEATGIDADPSANNYATDYPTEHGDLIRELEDIGTLDELQDLVGGEKELENLITDIVNKQVEVSPRYLKSTPPLNEYGEEFGARGAYGITTEELLQPQIQDVIKQNLGIDTPTNVVDDANVYYHSRIENLSDASDTHFGTYNAALDRASLQFGEENINSFYSRALEEAYDLISDELDGLEYIVDENGRYSIADKQIEFSFEHFNRAVPPKSDDFRFQLDINGEAESITLTHLDKEGYPTEIDTFFLSDAISDAERNKLTAFRSSDVDYVFGDKKDFSTFKTYVTRLADGLPVDVYRGSFDVNSRYNLYELQIKPDAKVVDLSGKDIEIINSFRKKGTTTRGTKSTFVTSEFFQYHALAPNAPDTWGNVVEIKIDGTSYKPKTGAFQNTDEMIEAVLGDADVFIYTNEIEDAGSPSLYVINKDAVNVSLANDEKLNVFNEDVNTKYYQTTPIDENLLRKLDQGKITQEQYDKYTSAPQPDTPTNVASSYHYNVEIVKGFPVNQNPENFWTNPSDAIFGEELTKTQYVQKLLDIEAVLDNDPGMMRFIKAMKQAGMNIPPGSPIQDYIVEVPGREIDRPFAPFRDIEEFSDKVGNSLYSRYQQRNYFSKTVNIDFITNTLIPALENKTLSKFDDVNRTNLSKFIYHLHHYEAQNSFMYHDSKADIIKKVIYGDSPIMETGIDFSKENRKSFELEIMRDYKLLDNIGIDKTVVDLVVDNQIEIKNIMQTHLAKVQNPYLPDTDYIVVFRAGELGVHGGATPISSASKSYDVSNEMISYQSAMGRSAGEPDPKVKAYLVNTAEIIDTEALGIRGGISGNEMEILAPDSAFIELDESTLEKIMQGDTIDEDIAKIVPRTEGGTVGAAKANDPRFGSKDVSEYVTDEGRNKWMELVDETPEVFEDIYKASKKLVGRGLSALQIFDPGDIVIVESLRRLAPQLGLASITAPALGAYVAYEVGVLLKDVGQALNKARVNQGLGTVAEAGGAIFGGTENADWRKLGKDTFKQFGEVSDDWSLSWKISEPIINYVFKEYTELKNKREEQDYISNIETGVSPR